jgi:hypothetical protein
MLANLALLCALAPQVEIPTGEAALLEPLVSPSIFTQDGQRIDPFDAVKRAHDRVASEGPRWPGWKLKFVSFNRVLREQNRIFGTRGFSEPQNNPAKLAELGRALKANYVITYQLLELTGARTSGFGARTTGRASIELRVFDVAEQRFVWSAKKVETSTKSGTKNAIQPRIDQALINAIRESLDPFAAHGLRMNIRP